MVLLNTVHSNALPITCIVVCYLYPTLNKVGWVMMFAPSGLMRVQLRYYLTILYFLLLFYCYLVGFEFRILVVGLSCLRLGCWIAIQVCFCSAFLPCLLFLFFTIFFFCISFLVTGLFKIALYFELSHSFPAEYHFWYTYYTSYPLQIKVDLDSCRATWDSEIRVSSWHLELPVPVYLTRFSAHIVF